jgi:hypothetical protein
MDASSEEFVAPGRSDPHRDLPSAPEKFRIDGNL